MAEIQILSKSRFGMVTYNPQISYPSLVDDFLNIFLPKMKEHSQHFVWAIEKDGTPDRHCHSVFLVSDKEDSSQKVRQKFIEFKLMKDFLKHSAKECMGVGPVQLQAVLLSPGEKLHHMIKIGYCLKENPIQREFTFSSGVITQCVKLYWSSIKTQIVTTNDWDLLTTKNIYTKLPYILKETNIDLTGDDLLYHLSTKQVGYVNITPKQLKTVCLQLKINQEFKGEKNEEKLHLLKMQINEHSEWDDHWLDLNPNAFQNPWIGKYRKIYKKHKQLVEDSNDMLKKLRDIAEPGTRYYKHKDIICPPD